MKPHISRIWPFPGSLAAVAVLLAAGFAASSAAEPANLAIVATPSTSYVSGHEKLEAINDGAVPANSHDKSHGTYGNWPRTGTQWVQYDWSQPAFINGVQVYWFTDDGGLRFPNEARLKYWNGSEFVPVPGASVGVEPDKFNQASFAEISTTKLRLEFDSDGSASTAVLEWRVMDSGKTPNFPPVVHAGLERVVVLSGKTYLQGTILDDGRPTTPPAAEWSKQSGPGRVSFAAAKQAATTARFSAPGEYVLKLAANDGAASASDTLKVTVQPDPPKTHLEPVWTTAYKVTSPFWKARFKQVIVNWIPYCIAKINDPEVPEGGIENFVQAGNKLAGKPAKHNGPVFANAWVYNTVESICLALMIDPQGDPNILASQKAMSATLDEWIPKLLSAQEPHGYIQTMYTINGIPRWHNRADHEDYNAGYFIDAAIAHYHLTDGKDTRLLDAAKRLANCYDRNFGPSPKKTWFGGHEEFEQSLVRLARVLEKKEGRGAGKDYIQLAKFFLDSRGGGDEYDQSHAPVTRQYEAVGHAVRAVYCYSGMADVAMETGDLDYHSAVKSIWDNLINKKYYVTGGVGSGETSEGFGGNYSLPNHSYCESCSGCGEIFFQHKMQLAYQDARYADLYEETLFNNVLGGLDLEGRNFYYTNPLDSDGKRFPWHGCPCCVGNIPRTLLSLPTWTYARGKDSLYVNLFIGSQVEIPDLAGTKVKITQTTDYPWSGVVSITVDLEDTKRFALKIRVPDRQPSQLYTSTPAVTGLTSISLNGSTIKPKIENGYVVIDHKWTAGDKIGLVVPMPVQRIKADPRIKPNIGRVALRYGPLVYNCESVDQTIEGVLSPNTPLATEWKPDLLGGVMVIKGTFKDGAPLMAIPNYSRLNRGGRSIVWMKAE